MIDGFQIGPLYVRFYGIVLMLGAVAGAWLATREAHRRGHDPEIVWDLLIYLIIGGVVGARLWHIFTPPPSSIEQGITTVFYLTHPLDAVAIWRGGLGIPGAIIGGAVVLYFSARRHKLSFAEWADIAAPSVALGQAIGRFGNFFNQELYGAPTNLPWKLYIDPVHRLTGFEDVKYFHPLFAYESILNFANMLFLIWITRNYEDKLRKGDVLLTYLVTYPAIRFSLDFLRLDASQVAGVNANQTVAAVVALCAAAALIWRHRSDARDYGESNEPVIRRAAAQKTAAKQTKSPGASSRNLAASRKSLPKKASSRKSPSRKAATKKKSA
jgi:phosphatidylglycerol:prolipoprotein diacylglycerol transferase